jgi:plasmid stability protein
MSPRACGLRRLVILTREARKIGAPRSLGGSHVDMSGACFYVYHMSTMIQIRNVPDALHRQLKSRAALAGMSLSDYLLSEIRAMAERPTLDELRNRLERRSRVAPSLTPADAVRAEREGR